MGSRDRGKATHGAKAVAALKDVRSVLEGQACWLAEENVDFIIAETFDRLDEAFVAMEVVQALKLPVMVTMSWRENDRMSTDGFGIAECAKQLKDGGADIIGFNCRREPDKMIAVIQEMRSAVEGPIAVQPWGLRSLKTRGIELRSGLLGNNEVDPEISERIQICCQEWNEFSRKACDLGVSYLGACCGAGPSAIRGMAEAMGKST